MLYASCKIKLMLQERKVEMYCIFRKSFALIEPNISNGLGNHMSGGQHMPLCRYKEARSNGHLIRRGDT